MTKDVIKTFRPSEKSILILEAAQRDRISITDAINEALELWASVELSADEYDKIYPEDAENATES